MSDQLAEQAAELKRSEREVRTLADSVPALFSYIDSQQRFRYANRRYEDFFQQPAKQLVGKTLEQVLGPRNYEIVRPHVEAALAGREAKFKAEIVFPSGRNWVEANYVPDFDECGSVQGFHALLNEITERKQAEQQLRDSEERFRAFTSATFDVVYCMSPDWTELRHLEGREFIADTRGPLRTWLKKYIHPDDQQLVMETIQRAVRTKSVFELEHRVIRVDGTLGWTHSRAVPILSPGGEVPRRM